MNCDELLMKSFSNQERCRYGEMILTDTYYLLENGAVIPKYTSNVMPFANCKHNYQSVLISTSTNTPCLHKLIILSNIKKQV